MTYEVKDYMEWRRARRYVPLVEPARNNGTRMRALVAALEDIGKSERAKSCNRFLYALVDNYKGRTDRPGQNVIPFDPDMPVAECLWCGDFFPDYGGRGCSYCTIPCRTAHARFRSKRECPWCGDTFYLIRGHPRRWCSIPCASAHRHWQFTRSA